MQIQLNNISIRILYLFKNLWAPGCPRTLRRQVTCSDRFSMQSQYLPSVLLIELKYCIPEVMNYLFIVFHC